MQKKVSLTVAEKRGVSKREIIAADEHIDRKMLGNGPTGSNEPPCKDREKGEYQAGQNIICDSLADDFSRIDDPLTSTHFTYLGSDYYYRFGSAGGTGSTNPNPVRFSVTGSELQIQWPTGGGNYRTEITVQPGLYSDDSLLPFVGNDRQVEFRGRFRTTGSGDTTTTMAVSLGSAGSTYSIEPYSDVVFGPPIAPYQVSYGVAIDAGASFDVHIYYDQFVRRFKIWKSSDPEPDAWLIEAVGYGPLVPLDTLRFYFDNGTFGHRVDGVAWYCDEWSITACPLEGEAIAQDKWGYNVSQDINGVPGGLVYRGVPVGGTATRISSTEYTIPVDAVMVLSVSLDAMPTSSFTFQSPRTIVLASGVNADTVVWVRFIH